MKTFFAITLAIAFVLITMDTESNSALACYSPADNEWALFDPSKNYKGQCDDSTNGCASTCAGEGKPGGRCVRKGRISCACYCYKKK